MSMKNLLSLFMLKDLAGEQFVMMFWMKTMEISLN
jgi:hypothetical protein